MFTLRMKITRNVTIISPILSPHNYIFSQAIFGAFSCHIRGFWVCCEQIYTSSLEELNCPALESNRIEYNTLIGFLCQRPHTVLYIYIQI